MKKYVLLIFSLIVGSMGCSDNGAKISKQMAEEFSAVKVKYEEKMTSIRSHAEYETLIEAWKGEAEQILNNYKDAGNSDMVEFVRSRILSFLDEDDRALEKLNHILSKNSPLTTEAKFEKVKILQKKKEMSEAVAIFGEIEEKLAINDELFEVMLNFAFEGKGVAERENYSTRLLSFENWPEKFKQYQPYLYENMAQIAREAGEYPKAKNILEEGIEILKASGQDIALEASYYLTNMIGKPAQHIAATTWINSKPLKLQELRGKVVVVDFWAPWCAPCRKVIPTLVDEFTKLKDNGLVVIGYTRLYGSYSDDLERIGQVSPEREIELTKGFVNRFNIEYPVAIAHNDEGFKSYSIRGIPTVVFIDRKGNVADFKIGSGNEEFTVNRIKALLEGV